MSTENVNIDLSNLKKENVMSTSFVLTGETILRNGIYYVDNNFQADIFYKEGQQNNLRYTNYHIKNFTQTNQSLLYQLSEIFAEATNTLMLQLDARDRVVKILNMPEIFKKWQKVKQILLEEFKNTPNIQKTIEGYEQNLQNESYLIKVIFYKGIQAVFFPRIRGTIQQLEPGKEATRLRTFHDFFPSIHLPVKETFSYKEIEDKYKVTIQGSINYDKIEKVKLLHACRIMFGKDVQSEHITFKIHEVYYLDKQLNYESGTLTHDFEVKGFHFRKEHMQYHPKAQNTYV